MAIILKANKVNLFVSSVLFVFWYHSPNILDTPHILKQINIHDGIKSTKLKTHNQLQTAMDQQPQSCCYPVSNNSHFPFALTLLLTVSTSSASWLHQD
jgi:hypothetical protein